MNKARNFRLKWCIQCQNQTYHHRQAITYNLIHWKCQACGYKKKYAVAGVNYD